MKCKDIEISVVSGNPFAEDKLNRQPLLQNLTDIANMYADTGAVIALDGEWGGRKNYLCSDVAPTVIRSNI